MVIRATGDQVKTFIQQSIGQNLGIGHNIMGVGFEVIAHGFLQANCLSCNHMLQRAALSAGENTGVQFLGKLLTGQDQAATGATKGLMGRSCDNVCIGHGAHMGATGNQAGDMGHIYHKDSTNLMGYVSKNLKIDSSGISRSTGNQKLGAALFCHITDFVIVNQTGLVVDIIGYHIIVLAGQVCGAAMGQMTTVGKAHAHHCITGLQQSYLHSHIGLSAGVGLYVGKFRTEQILCALNTQALQFVNAVTTTIVTLTGQALSVLVGQNGTHCSNHRRRSKILRCNQLKAILLASKFILHHRCYFSIKLGYKSNRVKGLAVHNLLPHFCY